MESCCNSPKPLSGLRWKFRGGRESIVRQGSYQDAQVGNDEVDREGPGTCGLKVPIAGFVGPHCGRLPIVPINATWVGVALGFGGRGERQRLLRLTHPCSPRCALITGHGRVAPTFATPGTHIRIPQQCPAQGWVVCIPQLTPFGTEVTLAFSGYSSSFSVRPASLLA